MRKRAGSFARLATPLKAWAQRFALLFLIGAAFTLMMLGRTESLVVERARVSVADAMTPVLRFISKPIGAFTDVVENVRGLADLHAENAVLRQENARLRQWQSVAHRLAAENEALRQMVNAIPEPGVRYITARVIGDPGGAFVRSVLVAAGARNGVSKGQAALNGAGLAGRVVEVGQRSARVLLITDINSRIPVMVGPSRHRAMLVGDNASMPRLTYIAPRVELSPGDRVLTSGHGGVFPPGLPVGVVVAGGGPEARVQALADWSHLEFLRLVDYELPGILEPFEASALSRVEP